MESNEIETNVSILTTELQNVSVINAVDFKNAISIDTGEDFLSFSKPTESETNDEIVSKVNEDEKCETEKLSTESKEQNSHTHDVGDVMGMDVDIPNSEETVADFIVSVENEKSPLETSEMKTIQLDLQYKWKIRPKLLCSATDEYKPSETYENYTKGCKWSPDGTCLMVPSEDFRIRIYELPQELYSEKPTLNLRTSDLKSALCVKEGGLVYDSCWYPYMNSWDPATCCFLSSSQETPIHLWDAFTGQLRATYRAYNQVDEVEPAISIRFINSGTEIWSGFKGVLRKFDTDRPGRQTESIYLKNDFPNMSGLVSCIRENPIMPRLVAFGTYSKYIGLYQDGPICCFKTSSGVTQVEFSPCGTKLYSVVRRNNEFLCWDLRNPGVVLWSLENREANTNQRIQFEVSCDGSTIVSGGTDGFVKVWEIDNTLVTEEEAEELNPISRIQLSKDCINGVSLHSRLPLLATSSGQRICDEEEKHRDNSVKLWWFGNTESN